MATGKVRIFELAKELGLSSKELIGLFGRLELEAKNQLSVVDGAIADLVRGVLLGGGGAARAAAPASAAASSVAVAEPPPVTVSAPAAPEPPAPALAEPVASAPTLPPAAPEVAPAAAPDVVPPAIIAAPEPVASAEAEPEPPPISPVAAAETPPASGETPRLRPVVGPTPVKQGLRIIGSPAPRRPAPAAPEPDGRTIASPERMRPPGGAAAASAGPRPLGAPPRPLVRPPAPLADEPIPSLRPVPAGQSTIAQRRPIAPTDGIAASADPGPQTGLPGRPGLAPRPGQPGVPGQTYGPAGSVRPGMPARPARPAGNGAFRALPPGNRPFTPRPPGAAPGGPGSATSSPAPSSGSGGGRPGGGGGRGGSHREDAAAKRDREKEMLLEKERQRKRRGSLDAAPAIPPTVLETIEIPDLLTVQELSTAMIIPAKDIIKELIKMGTMATINQNIPAETAQTVARKFGFNAVVKEAGDEVVVEQEQDKPEMMSDRPPVISVLGHVDHGKTSLLDRIRNSKVASGEAGGITQRIGAYTIEKDDRKITFLDTPGHEAFTAMRARGAKITDVAILVVAADDGVMPQTLEAISHIKAANVPIVVALNKIDKPNASLDRIKSQLADLGLQPVDWGGTTEMVPVSARTGEGIDRLLETVLLEADLRELKANRNRRAQGVVIESALDRGRGAVATVLVQNGTLRTGDIVVVGAAYGKIRALIDDKGKATKKAGPSIPVEIMGLSDVPSAGDQLMVVSDERVARETAAKRQTRRQDTRIAATSGPRVSLESFMAMPVDGVQKTLNLILKADGQGAVEALRARTQGISNAEVDVRVILAGVGAITPNDVNLASASNAVLIGFNIRPDETVKRLAENEKVDLRFYNVIYDVENDLKKALIGMLAPKYREVVLGRAEVREVFKVSKVGTIAGCYVQSGKLQRNAKVRILRDDAVVYESSLESLRRFKDDVKDVAEGYECGVQVTKYSDLKNGDVIEAFTSELVAPDPVLA